MKRVTEFKVDPNQQRYWLLDNQSVHTIENDTSIISTASKFIHVTYHALDLHLYGTVQGLSSMVDNGTKVLTMRIKIISGNLPQSTTVAVAGMHYGGNLLNKKLIKLHHQGTLKRGTKLDFRGAAITYYLWKKIPLNRNFLMYSVGINRKLPNRQ